MALTVFCKESEKPKRTKIVFLDPFSRLTDEANLPGSDVGQSVDGIKEIAVPIAKHRIDREIAPLGISQPVDGERNHCMAPICTDIFAQRRHFIRDAATDNGHSAVRNACRNGSEVIGPGEFEYRVRLCSCCDIDVFDGAT